MTEREGLYKPGLRDGFNQTIRRTSRLIRHGMESTGIDIFFPENIHLIPFRKNILFVSHNPHIIFFGDSMLRPGGRTPNETHERSVSEFIEQQTRGRIRAINLSEPGASTSRIREIIQINYRKCVEIPGDLIIASKTSINGARAVIHENEDLNARGLHIVRLYPRMRQIFNINKTELKEIYRLYAKLEQDRRDLWGEEFKTMHMNLGEAPYFLAPEMEFKPVDGSNAKAVTFTIKGHPVREPIARIVTGAFLDQSFKAVRKLHKNAPNMSISGLSLLVHRRFDHSGHLPEPEQELMSERFLHRVHIVPPRTGVIYSYS